MTMTAPKAGDAERKGQHPHGLLAFIARYLVMPQPGKKESRRQGGLERRMDGEGNRQHSPPGPLDEIRESIDAVLRESPIADGMFATQASKRAGSSIAYSFSRKTAVARNYRVAVRYHSTDEEEKIDVTITTEEEISSETTIRRTATRKEAKQYSFSVLRRKEPQERRGYEVRLAYGYARGEEQASVEYLQKDYTQQVAEQKEDFSVRVPFKVLHMQPRNVMGGVLGYTYLGENMMAMRDDLIGAMKNEVDIHESIHTPNEYETRVLTWWMMERPKMEKAENAGKMGMAMGMVPYRK